jgi:hypothetical protein
MRPRAFAAGLLASIAACTLGPTIREFEPAHRAAGTPTSVRTSDARIDGELLAVSDSGVVLLARDGVTIISYAVIRRGAAKGLPVDFGLGDAPDGDTRRMLRDLSRYPQGITPELLQKLLAAYRQEAAIVVR